MLTLLFAALALGIFAWMLRARSSATIAGAFLLFGLITRTLSVVYLDLFGPTFSEQLQFDVGGGTSMPLFAGGVLVFMLPLAFMFRPAAMRRSLRVAYPRPLYDTRTAGTLILWLAVAFVAAAYADMLVRGPVPLFVGMDRLTYNDNFAGPLHGLLIDHGFSLAFLLGVVFVMPRLAGGDFRPSAFAVYVVVMVYFALTGNRFSAFFSFTSFFIIPLGALSMTRAAGGLLPPPVDRHRTIAFLVSPVARLLLLTLLAVGLTATLLNSVINVRAYEDPAELFFQRIVVQPVELWLSTFSELDTQPPDSFSSAWDALFINPIDPTRNTTVRLLMINSLGFDRALQLADEGTQFAGGYPEIFFELLGTWFALPIALVFGIVTTWLLRVVVRSICLGRVATALCGTYVYYGFTLLYVGGMLNFLIVWTFWVKCGALLVVALIERRHVATAVALADGAAESTIIDGSALRLGAERPAAS